MSAISRNHILQSSGNHLMNNLRMRETTGFARSALDTTYPHVRYSCTKKTAFVLNPAAGRETERPPDFILMEFDDE
jgi:hypothetical protein